MAFEWQLEVRIEKATGQVHRRGAPAQKTAHERSDLQIAELWNVQDVGTRDEAGMSRRPRRAGEGVADRGGVDYEVAQSSNPASRRASRMISATGTSRMIGGRFRI